MSGPPLRVDAGSPGCLPVPEATGSLSVYAPTGIRAPFCHCPDETSEHPEGGAGLPLRPRRGGERRAGPAVGVRSKNSLLESVCCFYFK